jgi:N-acetylglucosaminyldiphosphoundecaprenol N-acetyl-beta-D-mannosaminyltransferase
MALTERAADQARFLGFAFDNLAMREAIDWVERAAQGASFTYVITPNVDHAVMLGETGPETWRAAYREAVAASSLTINDSRILARLARLSGAALATTPGSDLVRELVARAAGRGGTLALVGGRAEEAEWLRRTLPRWRIAHCDPPMGVRDDRSVQTSIAAFVEDQQADIVLLAIGAPQSEIVAHLIARRGRARGVGLCIGASVEFLSGAKRRAPRWMQRAGLEWLYRLLSEPRRLWRRYLVKGPRVFKLWWAGRERR